MWLYIFTPWAAPWGLLLSWVEGVFQVVIKVTMMHWVVDCKGVAAVLLQCIRGPESKQQLVGCCVLGEVCLRVVLRGLCYHTRLPLHVCYLAGLARVEV